MYCPNCKAEMSDLQGFSLVKDEINQYGRRQLTFKAAHKENIHWDGEKYHCSECGYSFSFKEGVLQE